MYASSLATMVMKPLQAMPYDGRTLFSFNKGLYLFLTYACGWIWIIPILTREGWYLTILLAIIGVSLFALGLR
jgi:hypothetical protein